LHGRDDASLGEMCFELGKCQVGVAQAIASKPERMVVG